MWYFYVQLSKYLAMLLLYLHSYNKNYTLSYFMSKWYQFNIIWSFVGSLDPDVNIFRSTQCKVNLFLNRKNLFVRRKRKGRGSNTLVRQFITLIQYKLFFYLKNILLSSLTRLPHYYKKKTCDCFYILFCDFIVWIIFFGLWVEHIVLQVILCSRQRDD